VRVKKTATKTAPVKTAPRKPNVSKAVQKQVIARQSDKRHTATAAELRARFIAEFKANANKVKPPPPRVPAARSLAGLCPALAPVKPATPSTTPSVRVRPAYKRVVIPDRHFVPKILRKAGFTSWHLRLNEDGPICRVTGFRRSDVFDDIDPFGTNEGIVTADGINWVNLHH
jgi:hypothetical protein